MAGHANDAADARDAADPGYARRCFERRDKPAHRGPAAPRITPHQRTKMS